MLNLFYNYSLEQFVADAVAFAPDLFLLFALITELMVTLFVTTQAPFPLAARAVARRVIFYLLITAAWMLWGSAYQAAAAGEPLFWADAFHLSPGIVNTKLILIAFGIFVLMIADPFLKAHRANHYEFGILVGLSIFAMFCVVSAHTLLVLYLSLELQALLFLILLAWQRQSKWALEATLKYLLVNLMASLFFLLALTRCFAAIGSVTYDAIINFYVPYSYTLSAPFLNKSGLLDAEFTAGLLGAVAQDLPLMFSLNHGLLLVVFALSVSFAFKFGVAPFHLWVPTIYGGGSVPVIALLATASKVSYAAALSILLGSVFAPLSPFWQFFYLFVGLISAWVGNILLYSERDLLRFVGISSIASGGYLYVVWALVPLKILYPVALVCTILSGFAYCNLFLLMSATYTVRTDGVTQGLQTVADLAYLRYSTTHGLLVFGVALAFASLSGIPPLVGFWVKFLTYTTFVFSIYEVSAFKILILLALMVSGVLGAVGYIRVLAALYFIDLKTFRSYVPVATNLHCLNLVLVGITTLGFILFSNYKYALWLFSLFLV